MVGAANLQGGQVVVTSLPSQPSRSLHEVHDSPAQAAAASTAPFAEVSSTPFLQPSLGYDANNVYLTLQVGGFGNVAQTPVQQAVGRVLDGTAPNATGDYAFVVGTWPG